MSRNGEEPKKKFHELIADQLIKQLEAGTAPWLKPWKAGENIMPYNGASKTRYHGANSLFLAMQGRSDPRWLTYNQAQTKGAQVRKGEKGTVIQYWQFHEDRPRLDELGNPIIGKDGKLEKVTHELERPKVINSVVFNAEQIDGLSPLPPRQKEPDWQVHERAEKILKSSGAQIRNIPGDRAYYSSQRDQITLPEKSQFDAPDKYYATALHELGHWTGHESRLDRKLGNSFGSEAYAKEELRAEIASLMIGDAVGVGHDPGQHAAYIGSWIKALKEDPLEIVRASADAEKIMGLVMSYENTQEQTQANTEAMQIEKESPELQSKEFRALEAAEKVAAAELQRVYGQEADTRRLEPYHEDVRVQEAMEHLAEASATWRLSLQEAHDRIDAAQMRGGASATEATRATENAIDEMMNAAMQEAPERIYLKSEFKEKDEIKALGAKYDRQEKSWYVLSGMALEPFTKWLPGSDNSDNLQATPTQAQATADATDKDEERIYLDVPFKEKNEAKNLGAKYDGKEKSWYVPSGVELEPFTKWMPIPGAEQAEKLSVSAQIAEHAEKLEGQERIGIFEQGKGEAPTVQQASENTIQQVAQAKTYLAVPFKEKDEVKALGAQYDRQEKSWYVPAGAELSKLAKWMPGNKAVSDTPAQSVHDEFKDALKALGCLPDGDSRTTHPVMDGKHHRVPVHGDKAGERSGFYFVHTDGRPAGFIQNNKTGETLKWKSQSTAVSKEQIAEAKALAAQKQADREAERAEMQQKTASRVTAQFASFQPISSATPYMEAKGIAVSSASGLKQGKENETVIPAVDIKGKHWTSQYIQADGTKRFAKDCKKEGCFHSIGGMNELEKAKTIVICEGFATGASIKQAFPDTGVVVAFDSGNLAAVGKDIAARWPTTPKIIAADDDAHGLLTHGKNVGRQKAEEAAAMIGAVIAVPVFATSEKFWPDDVPKFTPEEWRSNSISEQQKQTLSDYKRLTDFNDLAEKSTLGAGALERQIGAAIDIAHERAAQHVVTQQHTQKQSKEEKRVQKRPMPPAQQEGKKVRRSLAR